MFSLNIFLVYTNYLLRFLQFLVFVVLNMLWNRKIDPDHKAVIVTGCDSGFGNRLAFRLNKKGFQVYATVLDPNSPGSLDLINTCKFKDKMSIIQLDVTKEDTIDNCFDKIKSELDSNGEQLWALVNNAGRLAYGHTEWGQMDEYYKTFDVNVFGVVRMTRKFLPLIRRTRGRIVITASGGGRITLDNLGAYCMSKYAIISYSDALRREMKKFKVKVSTIEPGVFKTGMYSMAETIFENTWNKTDEDIRQLYGEQYFADQMKFVKKGKKLIIASKDLDIVTNDMIDAIMSKSPKHSYQPVNTIMLKPVMIFLPIIPQCIIDTFLGLLDRTVPDSMKTSQTHIDN